MATGERYLRFRCARCGRCCRDPLLPLTDQDVRRLVEAGVDRALDLVAWVPSSEIDLPEPEWYVVLRQGRRVMVLRHERGACRYLARDGSCRVYEHRPLGCRVFPFDPTFSRQGRLRRLDLIDGVACPRVLDGHNDVDRLRELCHAYEASNQSYLSRVAAWNREQRRRRRQGRAAETARAFLENLGLVGPADGSRVQSRLDAAGARSSLAVPSLARSRADGHSLLEVRVSHGPSQQLGAPR